MNFRDNTRNRNGRDSAFFIARTLLIILFTLQICSSQEICTSRTTCSSCITAASNCAWCKTKDPNMQSTSRCDSLSNINLKCPPGDIVDPKAQTTIITDKPLNNPGDPVSNMVQLAPQRLALKIRPNSPESITVRFRQAQDYPVDLYYLMDLSYSMNDDKAKLAALGSKLGQSMSSITRNFRLGFGSFVDKKVAPYVNVDPNYLANPCYPNPVCTPPYGFKNNMALNNNTSLFVSKVRDSKISGNVDKPEGGFDAILQAIVCKKEIGWREQARKILLVATDAGFHYAGDGKLGGIVLPNDGHCHLNSSGDYTKSTEQDYPSIHQLNQIATDNSMNILFAVTQDVLPIYQNLEGEISASYSSALQQDSSNIVELIVQQYEKISSTVELIDNSTDHLRLTYYSNCLNSKGPLEKTNTCTNLKVGNTVEFKITVELTSCPMNEKDRNQLFAISPLGLNESLVIELEMICTCDCEQFQEIKSAVCTSVGNYTCGICECPNDRFGEYCQCDHSELIIDDESDQSLCKMGNSSVVCSGRGTCACGKCSCYPSEDYQRIYGTYCECDNFSCVKHEDLPCGGPEHGQCDCGICKCNSRWAGNACECPSVQDSCIGPNGDICSGNGNCGCGKCQCTLQFGGQFCEQSLTPGGKCAEYRYCAECLGFSEDTAACENCDQYSVEVVDYLEAETINIPNAYKCSFRNGDGCNFYFLFYQMKNQTHLIVQKKTECPEPVNIPLVVGSVIGAILAIGLLTLLIWKLLTTLHDKREYAKFQNDCLQAKWSKDENPLFVNPNSRFSNPTFGKRLTYFFKS